MLSYSSYFNVLQVRGKVNEKKKSLSLSVYKKGVQKGVEIKFTVDVSLI